MPSEKNGKKRVQAEGARRLSNFELNTRHATAPGGAHRLLLLRARERLPGVVISLVSVCFPGVVLHLFAQATPPMPRTHLVRDPGMMADMR